MGQPPRLAPTHFDLLSGVNNPARGRIQAQSVLKAREKQDPFC